MDTITVLRLEDANGGGCFEVANMQDYTDAAVRAGLMSPEEDAYEHFHTAERGFPGLFNDEALFETVSAHPTLEPRKEGVRFGFASEEQAREWFPPALLEPLRLNGQTLTRWEVPVEAVAIGDRQVVFDRNAATLVERLPVEALHDDTLLQRQLPLHLAA